MNKKLIQKAKKFNINTIPKEILEDALRCSEDREYFVFNHCKSYDTTDGKIKLTPDFPYLKDKLNEWNTEQRSVDLKARQLYFSNLSMHDLLYDLLYAPKGSRSKVITNVGSQCYDGTQASLMGRLEFTWQQLPDHLRQPLSFRQQPSTIMNEKRQTALVGSNTTQDAGRGGSFYKVHVDEGAFIRFLLQILAANAPSSEFLRVISTANGKNDFYILYSQAESNENGYKSSKYMWNIHPERDAIWFKKATAGLLPAQIAAEHLCSFDASQSGRVFELSASITKALTLNDNDMLLAGMDYGLSDDTAILTAKVIGKQLHIVDELIVNNMIPSAVMGLYKHKVRQVYSDPSGENRSIATATSIAQAYRDLGLPIQPASHSPIIDGVRIIQQLLSEDRLRIDPIKCPITFDAITQCHYPIDGRTGAVLRTDKYADATANFNVHCMDALRYLCQSFHSEYSDRKPVIESTPSYFAELESVGHINGASSISQIRKQVKYT